MARFGSSFILARVFTLILSINSGWIEIARADLHTIPFIKRELLEMYFPLGKEQAVQRIQVSKALPSPDNSSDPFGIYYFYADREYALNEGRIFEDLSPTELSEGVYTFLITADGHIAYGRVIDLWEFGVKHIHLANGRLVVVAGEMKVGPEGKISFNLDSGSFTNDIIYNKKFSRAYLKNAVVGIFKSQFNIINLEYNEQKRFFPRHPPEIAELKKLCGSDEFVRSNRWICDRFQYLLQ